MRKFSFLLQGKPVTGSFSAKAIYHYERTKRFGIYLQDIAGLVNEFQQTGFYNASLLADMAHCAIYAESKSLVEPAEILEAIYAEENLANDILEAITESLPKPKPQPEGNEIGPAMGQSQ